jgi:hypothetical protein
MEVYMAQRLDRIEDAMRMMNAVCGRNYQHYPVNSAFGLDCWLLGFTVDVGPSATGILPPFSIDVLCSPCIHYHITPAIRHRVMVWLLISLLKSWNYIFFTSQLNLSVAWLPRCFLDA